MSSNNRSSRSSPKWRSSLSNTKRQRPATSVSLVFAEPEQGTRLGSAIDHLPAAVGFDDAASFMSQASRKRERTQSQASSFIFRPEQPAVEDEIPRSEGKDISRKRSKLSLDVFQTPELAQNASAEASRDDTQGSATNPGDLTQPLQPDAPCTNPPSIAVEAANDSEPPPSAPPAAIPFPTSDPQETIRASQSPPSRSSWFGFSRTKAVSITSAAQSSGVTGVQNTSSAVQATTAHQVASPSPSTSGNLAADAVSEGLASPTSCQASAAASLPQTIPASGKQPESMSFTSTQYSPPTQHIVSNTTSISSVDEEVPRPRFTSLDNATMLIPPQAIVESQVTKTADRKPSISSLNPSTSRFTLKLPLLGRPKIPLEQAVAVAQAEDIRDPAASAKELSDDQARDPGTEAHVPISAVDASQDAAVLPTSGPVSPEQPPAPSEDTEADEASTQKDGAHSHEHRAGSWWDYLGWKSQHAGDHTQASEGKKDAGEDKDGENGDKRKSASHPEDAPSSPMNQVAAPGDTAATPTAPKESADGKNKSPTSPVHTITEYQPPQDNSTKPASVFSAETAKSHGSVWYSPWAWYTTSPTTATSAQGEASDAPGESVESEESLKTESERVKEEALARDEGSQASTSTPKTSNDSSEAPAGDTTRKALQDSSASPVTQSAESPNPLESSIANNKSGWMSFFMSRALVVKSVANERHAEKDKGMEVMEIDDEPQPSAAIAIPTGNDAQQAAVASTTPVGSPAPPSTPKSPGKSPVAPPPKEREPRKPDPPVAPLTDSESIKRDTTKGGRAPSPTPSKASGTSPPRSTPNFVLPTWEDTFHSPPRSYVPPRHPGAKSKLTGALSYVTGALWSKDDHAQGKSKGKGKEREVQAQAPEFVTFGQELPKAFDLLGEQLNSYMLNGGCRVVVIGVAGWTPGAVTRTLAGGLPSSSSKFVNMTKQALEQFAEENNFKFKKITEMPLEGDGTIRKKVSRVYHHLVNNEEWMEDLHAADVIFVASHSQGAIISTHLVDRLIEDGHILTSRSVDILAKSAAAIAPGAAAAVPTSQAQKVCLLALCGVHLGPLRYLKTSSLLQPYIQYVENSAARELFEFQDTESKLSKNYIGALRNVMDHGTKVVYIASLNDQVVPIYSGLFTAASHPRILRALYIDNDAYHSSDFLSNLLILLIRIMNAGLSDRGLLAHLSEATAGTLSGVGHSTAYEELATYSLAVKYFFMTNDGTNADAELVINPFNAVEEQNDYEIPWLLRDMIADTKVAHFFAREFSQLRDAFDDWQPKTTILRDVKKKLQPITRLSTTQLSSGSLSKL